MSSDASRRGQFAYNLAVARSADYHLRAAVTRAVLLLSMVAVMAVDGAAWWTWITVAIAALGVWLSVWLCYHVLTATESHNSLIRWAMTSAESEHGTHRNNVIGQIDIVAAVGLSLVGPFGMTDGQPVARLAVFAAAAVFVSSATAGAFLDPAFYNPSEPAPPWMKLARGAAGPVLVVGAVALAVLGSWPASMWPELAAVCALPLAVQLRLRETDRLLTHGEELNRYTRQKARNDVVDAAHSWMSAPLKHAVRQAHTSADRSMFELLVTVNSSLQELTHLGKSVDADIGWPGVLVEPIRALCRQSGLVPPDVRIVVDELVGDDRDLTRLALFDLVGNAVTAGARRIAVVVDLQPDGRTLQIDVADDAGPFPDGAWQDDSGGLGRLRRHLEERGGRLGLHPAEEPLRKSIIAAWPMGVRPARPIREATR